MKNKIKLFIPLTDLTSDGVILKKSLVKVNPSLSKTLDFGKNNEFCSIDEVSKQVLPSTNKQSQNIMESFASSRRSEGSSIQRLNFRSKPSTDPLYNNIYNIDQNIVELSLKDFIYENEKLYINHNNFKNNKGLIIFYAPWCKSCKKISELIINLSLANINLFNFGAVNYENLNDKNDILCNYANIIQFPTIKYINSDGEIINYKYEYTLDNLIYFVNTN